MGGLWQELFEVGCELTSMTKKNRSFFDLSRKEKEKILLNAAKKANEEQAKLMQKVSK